MSFKINQDQKLRFIKENLDIFWVGNSVKNGKFTESWSVHCGWYEWEWRWVESRKVETIATPTDAIQHGVGYSDIWNFISHSQFNYIFILILLDDHVAKLPQYFVSIAGEIWEKKKQKFYRFDLVCKYRLTFSATLIAFVCGTSLGWTSPAGPQLKNSFDKTYDFTVTPEVWN
jgi:hypothetical protein